MKKRKELDALVANGKVGKRNKKGSGSCSAHELLRHDTESSDMEDFSILQPRRNGRKKSGSRLHLTAICLPLCQFVLVSTCILVSGTLIWLHIGLREDLDLLRTHLQKVEAGSRNTPEALHSIHTKLKQLDNDVTTLYHDIRNVSSLIDNITSEVKLLKDTTTDLQASIASAPAIQQLPKDVRTLSESVAGFGSKITAFDSTIKELKETQSGYQTTTQTLSSELESLKVVVQELSNVSDAGTKTSNSHFSVDVNIQKSMLETNESLSLIKKELLDFARSMDNVTTDMKIHQNSLKEAHVMIGKNHESIEFLQNSTEQYIVKMTNLEGVIQNSIMGRLLVLEARQPVEIGASPLTPELMATLQQYVNNSISEAIWRALNISFAGTQALDQDQSQTMKQIHNILLLISGLLKQVSGLPDVELLNSGNASEIMENVLNKTMNELFEKCEAKIEKTWVEHHTPLPPDLIKARNFNEALKLSDLGSAMVPVPPTPTTSVNPVQHLSNSSMSKN